MPLTANMLNEAFSRIEGNDLTVNTVTVSNSTFRDIQTFSRDNFDPVRQAAVLRAGLVGTIWNARVHVFPAVPDSEVIIGYASPNGDVSERIAIPQVGYSGSVGYSGPVGYSGSIGYSGVSGYSGSMGYSAARPSSFMGWSGTSGLRTLPLAPVPRKRRKNRIKHIVHDVHFGYRWDFMEGCEASLHE